MPTNNTTRPSTRSWILSTHRQNGLNYVNAVCCSHTYRKSLRPDRTRCNYPIVRAYSGCRGHARNPKIIETHRRLTSSRKSPWAHFTSKTQKNNRKTRIRRYGLCHRCRNTRYQWSGSFPCQSCTGSRTQCRAIARCLSVDNSTINNWMVVWPFFVLGLFTTKKNRANIGLGKCDNWTRTNSDLWISTPLEGNAWGYQWNCSR